MAAPLFVLVKQPRAWWPVSWQSADDGDTRRENRIELHFKRISPERFEEIFQVGRIEGNAATLLDYNRARLLELADGWRGIVAEAEDGAEPAPIAFDTGNIDAILRAEPNFVTGFTVAYIDFFHALPKAIEGNSDASPGGGPATDDAQAAVAAPASAKPSRRTSGNGARTKRT